MYLCKSVVGICLLALLVACSPQTLEVTREVVVEVPQDVEATVRAAVALTVAAWPTPTPVASPTPIPSPTNTLAPTSAPTATLPPFRWKDKVGNPLNYMVVTSDKLRGVTWYNHKSNPETLQAKWIGLYIAENEDGLHLLLTIKYVASDWLFIKRYLIGTDDQVFTIEPAYGFVKRDNSGGRIWEWYENLVLQSDLEMIEGIIESKTATLRYVGNLYHSEREISPEEKGAMRVTLAAFEELGGSLYELPRAGDFQ